MSSYRNMICFAAAMLATSTGTQAHAEPAAALLGLQTTDLSPMVLGRYQANPVARRSEASILSTSGVSDIVGTLSIQNFQGTQPNLRYTHASADGFRNYFTTWYRPNFAMRDTGVSVWLYKDVAGGDNYDRWASGGTDYGIDAVLTAWHSGHGGMSNNVFFASMGANWSGRGWNALSNQMALGGNNWSYGDERLRYLFWDTCNSVVVSGGSDPYNTWGRRSKGIRMVFGYTTTSVDNPNYGKYFWEEWTKGKTLSQAFLDASWRISTRQSPSVVAFGANQTQAVSILNTERFLNWSSSGNSWGQWRWYYARAAASSPRLAALKAMQTPGQGEVFTVVPGSNQTRDVARVARAFGINVSNAEQIQQRPSQIAVVETKGATLAVEQNGNFEVLLKVDNTQVSGGSVLGDNDLIQRAEALANELGLTQGHALQASLIRDTNEGGGSLKAVETPVVKEKTVVLDQIVDGVPFIDPNVGHMEISFDTRAGQPTRIRGSLQTLQTADRATNGAVGARLSVAEAKQKLLSSADARGRSIVPGSEAVGYQVVDGKAVPVYRAELGDLSRPLVRPSLVVIPLIQ